MYLPEMFYAVATSQSFFVEGTIYFQCMVRQTEMSGYLTPAGSFIDPIVWVNDTAFPLAVA